MEDFGDRNPRVANDGMMSGRLHTRTLDEPSIGELLKQLGNETSHLLRQEINLARTELRETGDRVRTAAVQIAVAAGIALAGILALTAFLVVALGAALDNYWAAALIVAVLMIVIASAMINRAMGGLKRRVGIPRTAQTLRDDAQWAREEAREFKRELTA
jgi:uncharacterized membrane protein YqjE